MAFLYLTEQGAVLRKAGDRFLVEKDDEVLLDLPYHKLETVLLFGNIQITTQAMAELLEKGVNLSLFSRQGTYRGSLAPPRGGSAELRLAQFERHRDPARALNVARAVVAAKVANGAAVLRRYRARNPVDGAFEASLERLDRAVGECAGAGDIAALDGVEGSAAREYFGALMTFNKSAMSWPGRQKHPATDPLNSLLSFAYTLIMHELTGLLEGAGLDPYIGFLHQLDFGRPSLALDLMEPFRHPVADRLTLTLVNRGVVDESDFQSGGERPGVFLRHNAMKRYFSEYEKWMLRRPKHADGSQSAPGFRDLLRQEVEKLCAALRAGGEFAPFRFGGDGEEEGEEEGACSTSSATISPTTSGGAG